MTASFVSYGGIHNLEGVTDSDYRKHADLARRIGFRIFDRIFETPWQRTVPVDEVYREMIDAIAPGYTVLALHFTSPGEIEFIEPDTSRIRTDEYGLFRDFAFRKWLDSQGLDIIGMRALRDELRGLIPSLNRE